MIALRALLAVVVIIALGQGPAAARECVGPGINHRPPVFSSDDVLSVLAFNVYMLPADVRHVPVIGSRFALAQEERAALIPRFLEPFDVVIFSEAYDDDARTILLDGMAKAGFTHSTHILGTAFLASRSQAKNRVYSQPTPRRACAGEAGCDDENTGFGQAGEGDISMGQDGGVIIVSRHPISRAKELVYKGCDGRDCRASKGFVYAQIEKGQRRYHVIGTHAQFGWGTSQRAARAKQMRAIWDFVENKSGIPRTEAVVIGGDFNVFRHELDSLLDGEGIGALAPTFLGHGYTRESRSDWAKAGNGYVDYVLAKKGWKTPRYASNCPMVFRTRYDFEDWTLLTTVEGKDYCDLSDHWAVWGFFDYRETPAGPDCPAPEFPRG